MRSLNRLRALAAVVGILVASPAVAVQVYALYGEACQETTGAIVDADEETATILTLSGDTRRVPIADIALIARYDVLENPFPRIAPAASGLPLLTVTSESSEGTFRAYATSFFEDLVLFLDDQGKIHVVQADEIVSIVKLPAADQAAAPPLPTRAVKLVSPPGRGQCVAMTSPGEAPVERVATLVMADKLRIDSFWTEMRTGYRALESLRERTLFYARPMLFDTKTRLGITTTGGNRADVLELEPTLWDAMPLYLEFGGGSAYRFQSSNSLGPKSWRMVPQLRPIAAWRSEFKSHLLHGIFLANLSGFTAGKPLYTRQMWDADPDYHRHAVWMDSSFNHLTLLGVDYGPWSLSYGYYFPSFALGQKEEFREFTSTKTSPVLRLGFQPANWQLELFVFNTQLEGENPGYDEAAAVRDEYIQNDMERLDNSSDFGGETIRYYSRRNWPEEARLTSTSARVDLTLLLPNDITAGADVSFTNTRYRESAAHFRLMRPTTTEGPVEAGPDEVDPTEEEFSSSFTGRVVNKIAQTTWGTRVHVRMDLGQWVALNGEASYQQAKTDGGFDGVDADRSAVDEITTYVVAMELLL